MHRVTRKAGCRVRIATAVATIALAVMSCDDGTGISSINGPWTLRTVNGAPLPYPVAANGTTTAELLDDVITLYVGGTWSQSMRERTTTGGQVSTSTRTLAGSYSTFGTSITLTASDGTKARIATVQGDAMTIVEPGLTMVYRK